MKNLFLMSVAASAMIFTSCSKEINGVNNDVGSTSGVAYLSIKVDSRIQSRANEQSTEDPGMAEESTLNSLYLLTFNTNGNIVGIPGSSVFYYEVPGLAEKEEEQKKTPDPVRLSASAKNLVMIANPGVKLLAVLNSLHAGSTFTTFNAAISDANATTMTTAEIESNRGFAMITGGDETSKNVGEKISDPYVFIGDKLKTVEGAGSETAAQAAAQADRLTVKLERFASKLIVKEKTGGATPAQAGAKFNLTFWTVDAVNSTYYPFAVKNLISATHAPGDYAKNFYTEDPNYTGTVGAGIEYGTVKAEAPGWSYSPILPWNDYYGWKSENDVAYVIENTMAAAEQKFGNATRIVIKATYTPFATENADWFHWAGNNYENLTLLQTAYTEAGGENAGTSLTNACDAFFAKIQAYYSNTGKSGFAATKFEALVQAELDGVNDGGEVVKDNKNAVIRWFQKGLCYYYYEIRHDNSPDAGHMAFAKYGVVRNNWYNLTLNSVSGPGTPWYPDINKPGEGDPEPDDDIDTKAGYLGVTVDVADWILWETGFGI